LRVNKGKKKRKAEDEVPQLQGEQYRGREVS
jgi:hypothetical protein